MKLEHCCDCDAPTGRAGKGEDSLYTEDSGPYCEECYVEHLAAAEEGSLEYFDRYIAGDR